MIVYRLNDSAATIGIDGEMNNLWQRSSSGPNRFAKIRRECSWKPCSCKAAATFGTMR